MAAKLLFGSYRKDDFADPDNFLLQLGMILERYPDHIVEYVTSPLTGIQRKSEFPPSIARVVEACDAETARQIRLRKYRELGPYQRIPRPPPRPDYATVLVRKSLPQYAEMVERSKTAPAAEFRFDEAGIWVAENWLPGMRFKS